MVKDQIVSSKEVVKLSPKPFSFDINKIVKKAQESYSKTEKGLASQLATGTSLKKPEKDSDFIIWTRNEMWQCLTGLKGIPYGYVVQISGRPDSGKSTIASLFMKEAQDQGAIVILWNSEHKFAAARFKDKMGGDPEKLCIVDTNNIINGAKGVAHFVNTIKESYPDAKILIVWDSIGSGINSTEDKEDSEDFSTQPGVSAKQNSYAIKKFVKLTNKYVDRETGDNTIATLLINQNYPNIGSVGYTDAGGSQVYYMSSIVLQLQRKQDLTRTKSGEKYKFGIQSRVRVKKNHLFEGSESLAELNVVVSAGSVDLASDVKKIDDIKGWEDQEDQEDQGE